MADTHAQTTDMDRQPLWRWTELCAALSLPPEDGPDVARVIIDSRQAHEGDLFVALPGDPGPRFNPSYRSDVDGHDYVADALARGAVGTMVHRPVGGAGRELLVQDTYDGLWALGRAARARLDGDVIAVTGSSGKTTFKSFMAAAIGAFAAPGSYNNHIGVPLSLANAPPEAGAWVFEIGTNHPGEIAPLAQLAAPTVAVVLNVHSAHIENFRDRDALIEEKLSIFNGLKDKSNQICEFTVAPPGSRTFGRDRQADATLIDLADDRLDARILGERLTARVPGGGAHRAETLLAVLLVTKLIGRDLAQACELPSELVPKGRGDVEHVAGVVVVDDSYNANPASMAAAIDSFLAHDTGEGRNVALLGQMGELGDAAPAAHAAIAEEFGRFDAVFTVGEGFRGLPGAEWHASADAALLDELADYLRAGDRLLVKGSNVVFWTSRFVERLTARLAAGQ